MRSDAPENVNDSLQIIARIWTGQTLFYSEDNLGGTDIICSTGPLDFTHMSQIDQKKQFSKTFPILNVGCRKSNFKPSCYQLHLCVEYSTESASVFCFACRMLRTATLKTRQHFSFINTSYTSDQKSVN